MTEYELVEVLSECMIGLKSKFGPQMFTKRRARKPFDCSDCGYHWLTGTLAWGQAFSSAMNRSHRICHPCVLLMLRTAANDAAQKSEAPDAAKTKTPKKARGTKRAK